MSFEVHSPELLAACYTANWTTVFDCTSVKCIHAVYRSLSKRHISTASVSWLTTNQRRLLSRKRGSFRPHNPTHVHVWLVMSTASRVSQAFRGHGAAVWLRATLVTPTCQDLAGIVNRRCSRASLPGSIGEMYASWDWAVGCFVCMVPRRQRICQLCRCVWVMLAVCLQRQHYFGF